MKTGGITHSKEWKQQLIQVTVKDCCSLRATPDLEVESSIWPLKQEKSGDSDEILLMLFKLG